MILRNPREPLFGEPAEHGFVAVDEKSGEQLGCCVVHPEPNPVLFPARPNLFRLEFAGEFSAFGQVLGAALALARALAAQAEEPSRIYAECSPSDHLFLSALSEYGFQDNDGLVRMRLNLDDIPHTHLPAGCVIVEDDLDDPMEAKFFLERYNQLFQTDRDHEWLLRYAGRPGFSRILCVAPTGLAGEVACWREGDVGRIGYIQTSKRWRQMGVAKHLLALAADRLEGEDAASIEADARVRVPLLLHTLESAGFRQERLLMRYPGVDIN